MKIESIHIYPIKIRKAPLYLGGTTTIQDTNDYYLRPHYRSIYSRNLETLLVKITTDTGIYGWGEALAPVGPEVTGELIKRLFMPFLIGEDPLDIDVIWSKLYNSMRERGYFSGFMVDAITAIDIALWDILGKSVQLPVYKLLGGAYRKELTAYVSGLPRESVEEQVELALQWKAKGFQAIKLHLGQGIEADVAVMSRLRDALGKDFRLMVDAHWQYSVPDAIRLGRRLESLNIEFLEAPTAPEDIEGTAEITRALDMAVAIGEAKRTRYQFKDRLVTRAADIFQPDVGRVGITEMKKIANMAEAFNIPIAPHLSVGQGICIAATLQVSAAIANLYIVEYQPTILEEANKLLKHPIICKQGRYLLPEGPGLGIDIDEVKLLEHTDGRL